MDTGKLPLPPVALLLDFDGVIVDSADLKIQAYARVYDGADAKLLNAIIDYQRLHGGVTRRDKFAHFERDLFRRTTSDESLDRLTAAYRNLVYDRVLACAFVPGAKHFLDLAHGRIDMHLVSGTPHDELVDIVERRGLAPYFRTVHGAPTKKIDAFAQILELGYEPARALAIGDSITEFDAARALGVPFLGIVPEGLVNPFPAAIPVLPSLENCGSLLGLQ